MLAPVFDDVEDLGQAGEFVAAQRGLEHVVGERCSLVFAAASAAQRAERQVARLGGGKAHAAVAFVDHPFDPCAGAVNPNHRRGVSQSTRWRSPGSGIQRSSSVRVGP